LTALAALRAARAEDDGRYAARAGDSPSDSLRRSCAARVGRRQGMCPETGSRRRQRRGHAFGVVGGNREYGGQNVNLVTRPTSTTTGLSDLVKSLGRVLG